MVEQQQKNYNDVVVICNPNSVQRFINEIKTNKGSTKLDFREKAGRRGIYGNCLL